MIGISSHLSRIFAGFRAALEMSRDRYLQLYTERAGNAEQFYRDFLQDLILPWAPVFTGAGSRLVRRQIERFFQTERIAFVAIDGTCQKHEANDFVLFFAGAYGAKGSISLEGDPPKIRYQKWELSRDVTMVAQLPIPLVELADIAGDDSREMFTVSDADSINLASIHISLMQLAEVFLAYNLATASSTDLPRLILIDQSISGLLNATAMAPEQVHLVGYPYDRRRLDLFDVVVALSHPFNRRLGVPTPKRYRQYAALLKEFHYEGGRHIALSAAAERLGVSVSALSPALNYLENRNLIKHSGDSLEAVADVRDSWDYTVAFFNRLCTRLFIDKDPQALLYEAKDPIDASRRTRWLSPYDVQFLTAVGLRALVEQCWARNILLCGVVKDSGSRYFSRNYLGVMKKAGAYPTLATAHVKPLPWTDRILLETLPVVDEGLTAPWSTIEFDAVYMYLHLHHDGRDGEILGARGNVTGVDHVVARSLAQFYLNRSKSSPVMGHVVFLDRLLYPEWDAPRDSDVVFDNEDIGRVQPFTRLTRNDANDGQVIMMYLLDTLTRNHFPEVIGYPDPLHKADWGAKTINRRVAGVIASAELPFRSNPIYKTLRSIRDSHRR